jgi:hypothetical protein
MPARASAAAPGCLRERRGACFERLRARLREQEIRAWLSLATLSMLGVAAVCGAVTAALHGFIVLAALGFTTPVLMIGRSVHRLLLVRTRLRELARRDPVLPRAVVYRR